jgi:hypothetical protein
VGTPPLPSVGDRPASSTDTKSGHPVSASFLRAKWLTRQFIRGTRSTADPPRDEPVDHSESIGQICLSAPFRRGCAYCQQPTLWWAMSQFFWLTRPPSLLSSSTALLRQRGAGGREPTWILGERPNVCLCRLSCDTYRSGHSSDDATIQSSRALSTGSTRVPQAAQHSAGTDNYSPPTPARGSGC